MRLDTIVSLGMLVRAIAESLLYRRFIIGLVAVILLTVITGMVIASVLVGSLYVLFHVMIYYGVNNREAFLAIVLAALALTGLLSWITARYVRRLRNIFIPSESAAKLRRVAHAFMEGLQESEAGRRPYS